jgi:hypothetical protein
MSEEELSESEDILNYEDEHDTLENEEIEETKELMNEASDEASRILEQLNTEELKILWNHQSTTVYLWILELLLAQ